MHKGRCISVWRTGPSSARVSLWVSAWRNNPLRQPVGPNAVQTVSIDGQPAYYIEGTWQFGATGNGTLTPPVWVPSGARRLVLERADVVIDLAAIPESLSNGVASGLI